MSTLLFSCTTENELILEKNQSNLSNREEIGGYGGAHQNGGQVLTHNQEGGGGGSVESQNLCTPAAFNNFYGNLNSGELKGLIVTDKIGPTYASDYFVNYDIKYIKNSLGKYVITKNFTAPQTNCGGIGYQLLKPNSYKQNVYILGNTIMINVIFKIEHEVPSTSPNGTSTLSTINHSKTISIPIQ